MPTTGGFEQDSYASSYKSGSKGDQRAARKSKEGVSRRRRTMRGATGEVLLQEYGMYRPTNPVDNKSHSKEGSSPSLHKEEWLFRRARQERGLCSSSRVSGEAKGAMCRRQGRPKTGGGDTIM